MIGPEEQTPHAEDPRFRRARLPGGGGAGAPPGSRRHPVPARLAACHPRLRGRVQLRRQSRFLLRHAHRHRGGDGVVSDRGHDRLLGARPGRAAVLQALRPRRRARPEHGDGVQRPRCRGARAGGVLQSRERGGRPPAARRLRLARHHAGWGPLAALGWHLRGALGDDPAGDHRGDAGREGGWRSGLLRPELPPGKLWQVAGGADSAHATLRSIVSNVDVLVGNEEGPAAGAGHRGGRRPSGIPSSTRARSCR